ncbi:hypothetical protein B0H17DRAFT_528339 [Mycena rosella]|uniref:Fungal-type protein kinase domain-containing protein n=1 Tax=Mycena rosella TaxID=1033263 RepID=A0AAD7MA38_MYCRO|nr:hypothetical protein B0H17DRAFT_528339 [Mycena rosella]
MKIYQNNGASTHETSLKSKNDAQAAVWAMRIRQNFAAEFLEPEDILAMYLPTSNSAWGPDSTGYNAAPEKLKKAVAAVEAAKLEKQMYKPIEEYLTASVQKFPSKTRRRFSKTDTTPFPVIDEGLRLHRTSPDMTVTFPGVDAPASTSQCTWTDAATIIEMKRKEDQDPVDDEGLKKGEEHDETLAQLAFNACNMLMQNGACFVFVVGIYGTSARLFRFDRTGVIASQSFSWADEHTILPQFFWRLCHPILHGARIAGSDPTISFPTTKEKEKMYQIFCQVTHIPFEQEAFEGEMGDSRCAQSRFDDDLVRCFTIGQPIYHCSGLFSRATRVDKVLAEDDPQPALYVLKDSWGQLCRRPESEFYEITQGGGTAAPVGVAQCRGGWNLGKERAADEIFTTLSAVARNEDKSAERGRRRTLTYPVGKKLTEFSSTLQLIKAFRDAIQGHANLCASGIFQRNISIGNAPFADDTAGLTYTAFLTDLDYSEINADDLETVKEQYAHLFHDNVLDTLQNLKDRTGTFKFLAIELLRSTDPPPIHRAGHDLESFYWLLVWILLRHTEHSHSSKPLTCSSLFDHTSNDLAAWMKKGWIGEEILCIPGNEPLTRLLDNLNCIFDAQTRRQDPVDSTHENVLAAFDEALGMEGWPAQDASKPFFSPSVKNEIQEKIATQTGGNQSGTGTVSGSSARPPRSTTSRKRLASAVEGGGASEGSSKKTRTDNDRPDKKSTPKKALQKKEVIGVSYVPIVLLGQT